MDSPDHLVRHDGGPRRHGQLLRDLPADRAQRDLPVRQDVEGQAVSLAVRADPGLYGVCSHRKSMNYEMNTMGVDSMSPLNLEIDQAWQQKGWVGEHH